MLFSVIYEFDCPRVKEELPDSRTIGYVLCAMDERGFYRDHNGGQTSDLREAQIYSSWQDANSAQRELRRDGLAYSTESIARLSVSNGRFILSAD